MQIIKLSATESTNTYLKELASVKNLADLTVVVTENQTKGRGQMNGLWESEQGKNLTFSVLKKINNLAIQDQFLISICVSLAVYKTLIALKIPDVKVKWPNDILSGNFKICGILIENSISGFRITSSVIGIGLNVNQITFENQPKAASLYSLLGKEIDLENLLKTILTNLEVYLSNISSNNWNSLLYEYHPILFKKDMLSQFVLENDTVFSGTILGVTKEGKLRIRLEGDRVREFALKEISLRY
ncbi:biotin--[acetyl-CoA-carboxylase] ligase [Maribacter sp. R77961]|jgi:BirA family biotin operon repressor/biotin-[acetyl-CoA-carboxylase] ligase|uniref:biotin--[acetyl-CoA-carboxylase] ligase n=1 Tax=Maribacter sp. R77961 TaxID=3093871 RepID=UPI0037C7F771